MRSGIWKGQISFGLLNIPVSLQGAEEDKEMHFSLRDAKDMSAIKFHRVNAKTGKEVPPERIVKAYEYEKNRFVVVDEKDFHAANVKATQSLEIEDFVHVADIDPILFEKPYYAIPLKGAEKSYALLRDALAKTERAAVGKIVLRTKQHLAILMPREQYLVLEMVRFAHAVIEPHEAKFLPKTKSSPSYSARELKMAEELIKGMSADWDADKYEDTYYNDLMGRIKKKVHAGKGQEVPEAPESDLQPTPPKDLMALLKRSLEAKTKTSRSDRHAGKSTKKARPSALH